MSITAGRRKLRHNIGPTPFIFLPSLISLSVLILVFLAIHIFYVVAGWIARNGYGQKVELLIGELMGNIL